MSNKYIYQKFLLNCDYESVDLRNVPLFEGALDEVQPYGEEYSLFDVGRSMVRKLRIDSLDDMIDTEDDWNLFIDSLKEIDYLVLYDALGKINIPIIGEYREATLKAYICRLEYAGVNLYIR